MVSKAIRIVAVAGSAVGLFLLQACSGAGEGTDPVNASVDTDGVEPQGCTKNCPTYTESKCIPVVVKDKFPLPQSGEMKYWGNSRLARTDKYKRVVPCVHVEKLTASTCTFGTDPQNPGLAYDPVKQVGNSGHWILGGDGQHYALQGQRINKDGTVGGDWVVGSKVTDGTVPCVEPRGKDSAGTPSGTELAGACTVETLLAPSNTVGLKVENYATAEVCTNSPVHPDGAALSRTDNATYWCYKGPGAGLNDINGTERDAYGVYIPGSEYCHVAWSSGIEVPAAKRPATKNFPSPGSATVSPIVWRPVNEKVPIANP